MNSQHVTDTLHSYTFHSNKHTHTQTVTHFSSSSFSSFSGTADLVSISQGIGNTQQKPQPREIRENHRCKSQFVCQVKKNKKNNNNKKKKDEQTKNTRKQEHIFAYSNIRPQKNI